MRASRFLFLSIQFLLLMALGGVASADGILVPKAGGLLVLHSTTLAQLGEVKLETSAVPLVASHPSAPVVACLTPEKGLVFLNAPGFSEASKHSDPLFKDGIVDLAFSQDGNSLYLLSESLRGVVVFDLSSSKVSGILAVPGGEGRRLAVSEAGVLVRQDEGLVLLSPQSKGGLLAQYRYSDPFLSGLVDGDRLYVSVQGDPGIWVYDVRAGQTLGLLPSQQRVVGLCRREGTKGLIFLSADGAVTARDFQTSSPNWTFSSSPAASGAGELWWGGSSVYVFERGGGALISLAGQTGKLQGRAELGQGLGRPVFFGG